MTTLGKRLIQAAKEAQAIARGEKEPARVYVPEDVDVKAIRRNLKMTQEKFSNTFGFPLATLRDWEQGRGRPDTSARAYLLVISREPQAVARALHVQDIARDAATSTDGKIEKRRSRAVVVTPARSQEPTRRRA